MSQRGHCSAKRNCRKRLRLKNSRPVPVCFRRFSGAKARTPKNLRKHSAHGRRAAAHPQYRPISRTDPRLGDVACAESLILLFRYYRINTIGRRGTAQYAASRSSPLTSSGKRRLHHGSPDTDPQASKITEVWRTTRACCQDRSVHCQRLKQGWMRE